MAVIVVGSRPETPDITKFFELSAVDKRFDGGVRKEREEGWPPYIRNSYLRGMGSRVLKCDRYTDSFLPTAILNHEKK